VRDVTQKWLCQFVRVQEAMPPASRSQAMIDVAGLAAMFEFGFQPGELDEVLRPTPGRIADRLTDIYLALTDALGIAPGEEGSEENLAGESGFREAEFPTNVLDFEPPAAPPSALKTVAELRGMIWALRSWDGIMLEKRVAQERGRRRPVVPPAVDPNDEGTP
jgi:hypothetical protein